MSITNQSSLAWLAGEVQATLASFHVELQPLRGLSNADLDSRLSRLVTCDAKAHAIFGAFSMASCEPLSNYAAAMQAVLQLWQQSPHLVTDDGLSELLAAGQSLAEFLRITTEKEPYSELSLFTPYQRMGDIASRTIHPLDLWHARQRQSSMTAWLADNVVQQLQADALERLSFQTADAILSDQVDSLMLGLIRYKKTDAATQLQLLCDWRMTQTNQPQQILLGTLLLHVIDALDRGHLTLDTFLKRYLLGSMAWLKGGQCDVDRLLNEAAFFNFVAWQCQTTRSTEFVDLLPAAIHLNRLATLANWLPLKGCSYVRAYFGQHARDLISAAQSAIDVAHQGWQAFCANDVPEAMQANVAYLPLSFEMMGQCLETWHACAHELNKVLQRIVLDSGLRAQRDVRVEVATALLTLRALVVDHHHLEEADIEPRLRDLTRRLESVCNQQPAGAFELWMLELQQRQGRMTARSLSVQQLIQKLIEIESILKHLWTYPEESETLGLVPEKLQQMQSVAHSLGLLDFVAAVQPVREKVVELIQKNQPMDAIVQQKMTVDFASLGLLLSVWLYEPNASHQNLRSMDWAFPLDTLPNVDVTPAPVLVSADGQEAAEESIDGVQQMEHQDLLDVPAIDGRVDDMSRVAALASAQLFALLPADFLDLPNSTPTPAALPDAPIESEMLAQAKVIGDLEISIPLYQAYLNETDEWSRQLAHALSEWALDPSQPMPHHAPTWAHAVAGSSATVGFTNCALLAQAVEQLALSVEAQDVHLNDIAQTLSAAADEIRRLLHQFAAGFIKAADPRILERIQQYLETPTLPPPMMADDQSASDDAEMLSVFVEESAQILPELGAALQAWTQSPSRRDYKTQALRLLHTLKGSARLVGEHTLAQKAHELESQIESTGDAPTTFSLSSLLMSYDGLMVASQLPNLVQTADTKHSLSRSNAALVPSGETIRIPSSAVERLVNQAGEIMIARARMETEIAHSLHILTDLGAQAQRLRDQLRELEWQTESQMQSRHAQISDQANSFDPFELDRLTRTQELTRFMAEALGDISTLQRSLQRSLNAAEDDLAMQLRQTRDLQRQLLRTRMVEFESISERLHRLVRMTSQELGKAVQLTIQNSGQEIDRAVLERVLPAFEHLLRNAVVHGIERPDVREAKAKNPEGHIQIQLSQQNNDVIVTLGDDGQGIDREALLRKAQQLSLQVESDADPSELIFMSGLSTSTEVSELAGRGIGLDVVRAQVQALGGRVEVKFAKDVGTTFKLIIPLTTAVTQIVLVRTGNLITGIPGNLVMSVIRAEQSEVTDAQHSGEFSYGGQTYPFYKLSQLLQVPGKSMELEQAKLFVMLLQSAGRIIALQIDEVIGNQEVVVKNLGAQLAQMPGLAGITVLPTGATALIYNPVALATVYGARLTSLAQAASGAEQAIAPLQSDAHVQIAPLVLVVDDSITMRRVLQRLLQREGYRVALAFDGKQALDSLRVEMPALVLSDVEMPRMDGFELLQSIRSSDRLSDLPVVMMTSRIADKHREHAKALGASEYLGKPYSENELLALLKRYVNW
ncbi:MAG: response regulator [Cytophagales bacterium]|nr:response regulator [Cytophagales bacterium]